MKKYKLYKLLDPTVSKSDFKNHIRYVGWTSKSLKLRLTKHINEAKTCISQSHTYKNKWINKLLNLNQKPEIELICDSDCEKDIKNLEIFYIRKYRKQKIKLTNTTDGGDGMVGKKWNENQKLLFNKPIKCYTKQGVLLRRFNSASECCKELKLNNSHVSQVLNGKRKSTGNLVFRFENDFFDKFIVENFKGKNNKNKKSIVEIDINNNIINEFYSINECCIKEKLNKQHLSFILKNPYKKNGQKRMCGGRFFKYKEDIV
jgi:hypothetical protein